MTQNESGDNRRTDHTEDSASPYDTAAIAAAAFDGDLEALALLEDLADEGDLDALVYADLAADNVDDIDGSEDDDDGDDIE